MAGRVPVAERRRQLVSAAVRVMTRDGVAAATTRAIAAEAGATLAILHYCFETKDELLRAAYTDVLEGLLRSSAATPRTASTPRARVVEDLMLVVRAAERDPGPLQLVLEFEQHALRRPGLADVPIGRRRLARERFTAYVERVGRESGVAWAEPAEQLADAMAVLLDGVVVSWLVERDTDRATAQVTRFVTELFTRSEPAARAAG